LPYAVRACFAAGVDHRNQEQGLGNRRQQEAKDKDNDQFFALHANLLLKRVMKTMKDGVNYFPARALRNPATVKV
jgi:hypothetical protein